MTRSRDCQISRSQKGVCGNRSDVRIYSHRVCLCQVSRERLLRRNDRPPSFVASEKCQVVRALSGVRSRRQSITSMSTKLKRNRICVYCGEGTDLTREHVLPDCFQKTIDAIS